MRPPMLLLAAGALGICLSCGAVFAAPTAVPSTSLAPGISGKPQVTDPDETVGVEDVQPRGYTEKIPLDGDRAHVYAPGSRQPTLASLQLTMVLYGLRPRPGEPTNPTKPSMYCLELRSTSGAPGYLWCFSTFRSCGRFKLLSDQYGTPYLSWIRGQELRFADVSRPRSFETSLTTAVMGRDRSVVSIPLGELIPPSRDWGARANWIVADARSIRRRGDAGWVVEVGQPNSAITYTLVSNGTKWHRRLLPKYWLETIASALAIILVAWVAYRRQRRACLTNSVREP